MTAITEKKARGRPRSDTAAVNVRMPASMISALDAFIATLPDELAPASRPEAVRHALADWLADHGYLRRHDDPEGAN